MDEPYSTEWWRWKLYRQIAEYLHQPSVAGQAAVQSLLQAYREQQLQSPPSALRDEHEWVMDWR
jgi:hypothetical protein